MIYFILGFFSGAYVAQKYNIPDVEKMFKDCLHSLQNHEKDDKDDKKKNNKK
jgi:hypothetical protein